MPTIQEVLAGAKVANNPYASFWQGYDPMKSSGTRSYSSPFGGPANNYKAGTLNDYLLYLMAAPDAARRLSQAVPWLTQQIQGYRPNETFSFSGIQTTPEEVRALLSGAQPLSVAAPPGANVSPNRRVIPSAIVRNDAGMLSMPPVSRRTIPSTVLRNDRRGLASTGGQSLAGPFPDNTLSMNPSSVFGSLPAAPIPARPATSRVSALPSVLATGSATPARGGLGLQPVPNPGFAPGFVHPFARR